MDSQGNVWEAEKGFEGGQTIDHTSLQVTGTTEPGLYRAEHYSMDSWSYKVPNGTYIVKLHFSEDYDGVTDPSGRIFSFDVQGQKFKDFSPWKKAGAQYKAYVETVKDVKVTDGQIKITFTPQAENPQINAIEIILWDCRRTQFFLVHLLQAEHCSEQLARAMVLDFKAVRVTVADDQGLRRQRSNPSGRHHRLLAADDGVDECALTDARSPQKTDREFRTRQF